MALRKELTNQMGMNLQDFMAPVFISIRVALISSFFVFLLGTFASWRMVSKKFIGKSWLETLFMLPLVLPPSVVGFLLLICFGRNGWLGGWIEAWFHVSLIFTWWAAVVASVVVAFPLVYQTMKVGFSSVDKEIIDAAKTEGAGHWQIFRYFLIPLSIRSLKTAYILGFARSLGEFGATIMVAGNIPDRTQTIPTAIFGAVDAGHLPLAWAWSAAIIIISFMMLRLANRQMD
jgi:molybdate transport system permease protein